MSQQTPKASDIRTGDIIQFFAVPYGPYASTLTPYRVEVHSGKRPTIRVINVANGSSTWDFVHMYRGASFEIISQAVQQ